MANGQEAGSLLTAKYRGKTVLAVGAHPDDIELGAGGTVARLSDEGAKVTMLVVCSPNSLASRRAEAEKAAAILGATVLFLFGDNELRVEDIKGYELVAKLDQMVRTLDPAVILTHAAGNFHRDHRLVHEACVSAQRLHFFDMLCFQPTSCHPVSTSFNPQAYVDITSTITRKMAAINEHVTQFSCKGLGTGLYVDTAREYGRLAGSEYAEWLEVSRLKLG